MCPFQPRPNFSARFRPARSASDFARCFTIRPPARCAAAAGRISRGGPVASAASSRQAGSVRMSVRSVFSLVLPLLGLACSEPSPAADLVLHPRLPRTNLLIYSTNPGAVLPVRSVADWRKRRASILQSMQAIMGPLPDDRKRCALAPRIEDEADCGDFVRRLISYSSEPGSRVTAHLLVPKQALAGAVKAPAVLALHQTHPLGARVVVGLGQSPNDEYGLDLVRRGYVVLAPPYPLLADYQPDLGTLGYQSGTMKAIWDNMRGLDLLASLPFVKTNGFGAIGHSLGGHNAVFTAAFDERIQVVVSSCGLDSFLDYKEGNITGWTSQRYMPRLLEFKDRLSAVPFDFPEVIAALAPRVCFLSAPRGDTNFKWRSVDGIARVARAVYELHGVPNHLRAEHPDCGHLFPREMREQAYKLFDAVLR